MSPRRLRPSSRLHDDSGVVLIFSAIAMVALLIMVAFVIDLGGARASRRNDQQISDDAALAAGFFLSGRGNAGVIPSAFLACKAAINSVQTDVADFTPKLTDAQRSTKCAPFPADLLTGCSSTTNPTSVTVTAGKYVLTIRYPIPASEIADSRFSGGAGADDGTNQCERMRITFHRTEETYFARIVGVDDVSTEASTVVRANTSQVAEGVAALLLLERVGCASLQTSGGGSQGSGVVVRSSGPNNPGVIQSDSAGIIGATAPIPCTTNANPSGYAIYGTALPGGGPSITAEPAPNGQLGVISVYGLTIGGASRGAAVFPGGLSVAPGGSSIASRQSVDNKYNRTGILQLANLHSTAYAAATMSPSTATANGYTVIQGSAVCTNLNTTTAPQTATKIFVNCPTFTADVVDFPNATDVVFTGKVDVPNNKTLSLPVAHNIFIRGCPGSGSCGGGNNFAVSVAGTMTVNLGSATSCAGRAGPGSGGSTTNTARIASFGGPFLVDGSVRLCQTFVYLGPNGTTYSRQTVTATGTGPENYPASTICAPTLPCPKNNADDSFIRFATGGAGADWSAPNQLTGQPTAAQLADDSYKFEDISLWSETSVQSAIKSQGSNTTQGVYFLPNATAVFTGQATQDQPLNAQFLVRSLNISGQGSLFLKPNPDDSVLTAIPGNISFIR